MTKPIPEKYKTIPDNAELVFKGEIHDVYQWQQPLYDGTTATFEMLKRPDTVVILCVVENDEILVLQQEQPDRPLHWTLPAGRVDEGEEPLAAAKRETLEETGYSFSDWKLVECKQVHNKFEWISYFYIATNQTDKNEQNLDGGEKITVQKMSYEKLLELIRAEKINFTGPIVNLLLNGRDKLSDILSISEIK